MGRIPADKHTVPLGGIATGGYLFYEGQPPPPHYLTAAVERGAITTTVNATGIVNAVTTVQVGTQVSGMIQKLFVDFNSPVKTRPSLLNCPCSSAAMRGSYILPI